MLVTIFRPNSFVCFMTCLELQIEQEASRNKRQEVWDLRLSNAHGEIKFEGAIDISKIDFEKVHPQSHDLCQA